MSFIKKIKNHFLFFKKDKENTVRKKDNSKEIIFFSFDSFKKVSTKAVYKIHPLFIIIKNNKIKILKTLLDLFNNEFNLKPKVGIELEFYLYKKKKDRKLNEIQTQRILDNIYKESKKANINILELDNEKGAGQFEVRTETYENLQTLSRDIVKLKKIIKSRAKRYGFFADFKAQPFIDDCGSSLQVNISLVNENKENLFERILVDNEKIESDKLLNSVNGLCELMNVLLPFFVRDESCYERYNLDLNKFLHQAGKYPAPTFVSWGVNNRTTAIRIPNAIFKTVEQYEAEGDRNRRIEHRVPSSNADIYMTLIGVLSGIYYGLKNKSEGDFKTYSNVFETKKGFEKISCNRDLEKFKKICKLFI